MPETKIKAIIVDDEEKLRELLRIKIQKYCPTVDIIYSVRNIDEAEEAIRNSSPDILFLDISMPGGSGFELLERFDSTTFEVVFVTGYDEYVLNALKVSAIDYLLKPVETSQLISAVNKATKRIEDNSKIQEFEVLKHNMNFVGKQESKLVIPGTHIYEFIQIKDIIRCEGWQKYTKIFMDNGSHIVSSYNIGRFTPMLRDYGFYLIHRSHLINTEKIKKYHIEGTVVLSDGSSVPVSRRKREDFLKDVVRKMSS